MVTKLGYVLIGRVKRGSGEALGQDCFHLPKATSRLNFLDFEAPRRFLRNELQPDVRFCRGLVSSLGKS